MLCVGRRAPLDALPDLRAASLIQIYPPEAHAGQGGDADYHRPGRGKPQQQKGLSTGGLLPAAHVALYMLEIMKSCQPCQGRMADVPAAGTDATDIYRKPSYLLV